MEQWLQRNPLKGWLLADADLSTFHAWGVQQSSLVFIDREARVIGFDHGLLPNEFHLKSILAGQPEIARLRSKPQPFGGDKPDIAPSYQVHISPSRRDPEDGASASSGPDHWTRLGYELKPVLAEVYGADKTRIDLPAHLDAGDRYDFELLPPQEETHEKMFALVRQGIEQHFSLTVSREARLLDVYVLTMPEGTGPSLQQAEFGCGGFMGSSSIWRSMGDTPPTEADIRKALASASLSSISGSGMSIPDACRGIERYSHLPIVDETGLEGDYNFQVDSDGKSNEAFLQALYEQLGIVATPAKREIQFLVLR